MKEKILSLHPWRLLMAVALLAALFVPAASVVAQAGDQDDRLVEDNLQGGGRFLSADEYGQIDRDYTDFGSDAQGQDECGQYWVVLPGEYLGLVAINCDVPMDNLLDENPDIDDPTVIYPGQVIAIPEGNFSEITDPQTGRAFAAPADTGDDEPGIPPTGPDAQVPFDSVADLDRERQGQDECGEALPVLPGWTLSTIVVNCDIPYANLLSANPDVNFDALQLGQTISIPEGSFNEIFDPFTERSYTFPATAGVDDQADIPGTGGGGQIPPISGGDYELGELEFGRNGRLFIPDRSESGRLAEIAAERDYTEFDADEQGLVECGTGWVILTGESISTVIVNCDVPRQELLDANPWIDTPGLVYPGEVILIPEGDYVEINDPFTGNPYTGETLSTTMDTATGR